MNISIIIGSTREGRFGDKVGAWVAEELKQREGITYELLDLRDYDMPFFNEAVSPAYKEAPYTNEAVARFTKKIDASDGFIIVTPEYNHSTSAVLKNALDWVSQEWANKAVGFVSYGSVGGARAIEHLRLIAAELQMASIRNAVMIPGDQYFPVLFGQAPKEEMFAKAQGQLVPMVDQLLWWTDALKKARG